MSACSFTQHVLSIHRNGGSAVQLLHGWCWCHVKLSGEFDGHLEWSGLLLKEISDLANFHKFLFHHPSSYTVLYETEEREVSVACFFFFLFFFFTRWLLFSFFFLSLIFIFIFTPEYSTDTHLLQTLQHRGSRADVRLLLRVARTSRRDCSTCLEHTMQIFCKAYVLGLSIFVVFVFLSFIFFFSSPLLSVSEMVSLV